MVAAMFFIPSVAEKVTWFRRRDTGGQGRLKSPMAQKGLINSNLQL